jgi:hypothetical protein
MSKPLHMDAINEIALALKYQNHQEDLRNVSLGIILIKSSKFLN